MRISIDNFLVEVDSQFVKSKVFDFIDADFNPQGLATKIGRIKGLPISLSEKYKADVELNEGDVVVFHHNVCQNKNKFNENLFICAYFNMYAKIDGDSIIPLEDAIFCEKMIEPGMDLGCFKVASKVSDKYAKVFEVSNFAGKQGIEKGDIIFFTKNADYDMNVLDVSLLKMHIRNVIGIERNGNLKTFGKKLLIKNTTRFPDAGDIKRIYASSNLQTGVVIEQGTTSIPHGSLVTYFAGLDSQVTWKGQNYSFVKEDHIKYIVE